MGYIKQKNLDQWISLLSNADKLDAETINEALSAIEALNVPFESLPALIRLLSDRRAKINRSAAYLLGMRGEKAFAAKPKLLALLNKKGMGSRFKFIFLQTLAFIVSSSPTPSSDDVDIFKSFLSCEHAQLRQISAFALGEFGPLASSAIEDLFTNLQIDDVLGCKREYLLAIVQIDPHKGLDAATYLIQENAQNMAKLDKDIFVVQSNSKITKQERNKTLEKLNKQREKNYFSWGDEIILGLLSLARLVEAFPSQYSSVLSTINELETEYYLILRYQKYIKQDLLHLQFLHSNVELLKKTSVQFAELVKDRNISKHMLEIAALCGHRPAQKYLSRTFPRLSIFNRIKALAEEVEGYPKKMRVSLAIARCLLKPWEFSGGGYDVREVIESMENFIGSNNFNLESALDNIRKSIGNIYVSQLSDMTFQAVQKALAYSVDLQDEKSLHLFIQYTLSSFCPLPDSDYSVLGETGRVLCTLDGAEAVIKRALYNGIVPWALSHHDSIVSN